MRFSKRWMAVVALTVAIGVISISSSKHKSEDKDVTTKMTQKMITVCVGRFLIDLPEGSKVEFAPTRVAGVTINVRPGYAEATYKAELEQREQELSRLKNEYDKLSLEKTIQANAVNFQSTVFYYGREKPLTEIQFDQKVAGTEEGISVEAFGLYHDILYKFKAEHLASPRFENNVLELVKKFEARGMDVVPSQPGFCTDNGLIHDPIPADDNESITMFASLAGHPDVVIRLDTSVNDKQIQESLLERDAQNSIKREHPDSFKNFRRQHRTLNGIDGDEVLDKFKEANGTSAHMFTWAGLGKLRDVLSPKVTLELETGIGRPGQPINSSLSDADVLELWDRIAQSLRLRPTSVQVKAAQANTSQQVPLGELVATGKVCPQTGYWKCSETDARESTQPKFFRQGDVMPHAVLLGAPSLWQKLSGNVPSHQVTTVWRLIGYDTAVAPKSTGDDFLQPPNVSDSNDDTA